MRSAWRTLDRELLRDVLAVATAVALVGVSFGAIAVASGLSPWLAITMCLLVFAGGSQFMAVGVVAAGGGVVAAVVAGLLLNARFLPFGLATGDVLGRSLLARLVGSHLLIDETVAFALAQRDPARRRAVYWVAGTVLFVTWHVGVVFGVLAGQVIGDPNAFGVDAAFPAGLLALLLPSLRERAVLGVALLGAVIALVATPFLPAGIPVLLALLAVLAAVPATRTAGRTGDGRTDGGRADAGRTGAGRADGGAGPTAAAEAGEAR
ncbi:AzlC family ABC transporter permease [Streptoalloteichus hindustanus]|uniref:AzlC family ABC transporter permease n=1 Tax=Streptoalloteichus hindustanus TaxID=2017 RepID=UPI0009FBE147|nr:AzlC family ABC transporter permease [Streptoalloteichus hindustanus]